MSIINLDCCFLIWEFVGKNSIYLNKELFKLLNKKREEFKTNPIKLYYRLAKFKEVNYYNEPYYGEIRRRTRARPSIVVEKELKTLECSKIPIGILNKNTNTIIPSKQLHDTLVPVSKMCELGGNRYFNYRYKYTYWEIFSLYCDDEEIKRVKLYQCLFPCKKLNDINILNVF